MRIVLGYLSRHIAPGEDFMSLLPTGLPVMAAMLEGQGHEVLLANFSGLEPKKALRVLREFDPGLAGFSLFTHNRLETFELAGLIRRSLPGCRIILGGPHASPLGDEILARETCIDWVVQGEGETILSDLVRVLAACDHTRGLPGSRTVTASGEAMHLLSQGVLPPRATLVAPSRISDLDTLPPGCSFDGATFGVDPRSQYSLVIGSRGCAHACAFCSSPTFWGRRVSFRSARSIVGEIRLAHTRYGITYFHIRDDNFTLHRERALEFARLIRTEGPAVRFNCQARVDAVDEQLLTELAEAGLEHIQFGVESGSMATLARFAKDVTPEAVIRACAAARGAGIVASVYLIGAVPDETGADIRATRTLLEAAQPHDAVVSPLAIFPGTELCRQATDDGAMDASLWFRSREPAIFAASGDRAAIQRLEELSSIVATLAPPAPVVPKSLEGLSAMRLLSLGEQCTASGMHAEAGRCFAAAAARAPRHPWCLYRLAEWQLDAGKRAQAGATAQALVALEPGWEEAALLLEACRATPRR